MYIDESGGTDETVTSEEMTVTVDGEEYHAEPNYDLNADGVNDTTVVHEADGSGRAYVDSDDDGEADSYVELDTEGHVVAEATYDEASGEWVEADPGTAESSAAREQADTSGVLRADLPGLGDAAWGDLSVTQPVEGVAKIDATTGLWISQN